MAKDKMTNLQRRNIDFVKAYLQQQLPARRVSDVINFTQQQGDDIDTEFVLNAAFDCGGYKAWIIYDVMDNKSADFYFEFLYENCEHHFSIDDIFSLFDIMDFKDYCYIECFDQVSIKKAIDSILDTIQKYHYELKRAGESDNLKRLCEMFEADRKIVDSDLVKVKDIWHLVKLKNRFAKTKSDRNREKLIKELEKRQKNGTLVAVDRRYLAYLKAGYEVEEDVSVTGDFEKLYRKYSLSAYAVIFLTSTVVALAVYCINHMIVFKDCIVYTSIYRYISLAISAVVLWYAVSAFFGKKIIVKLCPEEAKEYAKIKFESNYDENKIKRFGQKVMGPLCGVVVFLIFIAFAASNIGFSENYIIINHCIGMSEIVEYKDVTVYRIAQHYNSDDEIYLDYENPCYELSYGDGCFPMGEIKDKAFNEKLVELFDTHNVNVETVQNEEELSEKYDIQ